MIRILMTGVVGCALSWAFGHFLLPVLHALKAGASIREIGPTWHNNKTGTPLMGGLMFILASLVCLLGNLPSMTDYSVFYVLLLSLCFGFIGFLDDFTKVRYHRNLGLTTLQKAMLQMAVSAVFLYAMYKSGAMDTHLYIPFWGKVFYLHPIVYIFFAMFVMVGCVNAVNLTDGVDGLSSSVTLPVMVFFAAASVALGKFDLALLPASLVGGLLAYLTYNWHPAKVFMGDTGSLFLGGVVCAMAFALEMPLILVLVGFVYVCEAMSDILQVSYFKLTHGKRLFKMAPIHHHFEMCGWKEEKIVLSFAGVSAVMCILAWFGISGLIG
ncbi:MAG: phospho-N-acetylmuramoyl-pentapeptide-transferase [Candidatus Faecousia sp.]|nr:phospho-N-acetylmuramoyl-pentapeptide-transferase [Candidatus Faecousia sp.]